MGRSAHSTTDSPDKPGKSSLYLWSNGKQGMGSLGLEDKRTYRRVLASRAGLEGMSQQSMYARWHDDCLPEQSAEAPVPRAAS